MRKRLPKIVMMLILSMTMSFAASGSHVAEAFLDEPALGQICLMAFNFAPMGWAECRGQLLPVNQNKELFNILGNRFGGDGVVTFALPNLQSPVDGAKYCIAIDGYYPSGVNGIIGQIELLPYDSAPSGWVRCQGQKLPIAANEALYSILGNTFGGDSNNFYLPDLRSAEPNENLHYYICLYGMYPQNGSYSNSDGLIGSINLYKRDAYLGGDGECDGGTLDIIKYQPLYALIGNNYGGNGLSTFGKPDLRGFTPHPALSYYIQTRGIFPLRI